MSKRIFLAGAAGAIGRRLAPLLLEAGHSMWGTTRSTAKATDLEALGVTPVIVDMFNAEALSQAVIAARPEIVIHQLTDLPRDLDPALMGEAIIRTARLRDEGTRNLVAASREAGVRRLIAQSIAWLYAPGREPHSEDDPLDMPAENAQAINVNGIIALERQVLDAAPIEGIVLRYGQLYGPGTATGTPKGASPVHVDAAAYAALLAVDHGQSGIYNIAEPNALASTEKAAAELGWRADFRISE